MWAKTAPWDPAAGLAHDEISIAPFSEYLKKLPIFSPQPPMPIAAAPRRPVRNLPCRENSNS